MATKSTKKPLIKSNSLEKTIASSVEGINSAFAAGTNAVTLLSKEAQKFANESKRLNKKRALLAKRKTNAAVRAKKTPTPDTRKALKVAETELAAVTKELNKVKPLKVTTDVELKALRDCLKRASAYNRGIQSADKILNKPVKKRKKVTRKKAA